MNFKFGNSLFSATLAVGLCFGMLLALEIGRRLGKRRLARDPESARAGLSAVEGSVFGLLGLLIAFTFGGAASRFEGRRALIVQEANAISTAWARLDMLPSLHRASLRDLFRRYLDSRLRIYSLFPDADAAREQWIKSNALQQEIWKAATAACRIEEGRGAVMLVLPPLNEMFDITTTRRMALLDHPPGVIFAMLGFLAVSCAMLAGYAMAPGRERSWTHMFGFAFVTAIAVYVILDLEFPRFGFIRIDAGDLPLIELRQTMN